MQSRNLTELRPLMVLSFVLVIVTLGYGIVIPIFPFYIDELGGSGGEMGLLVATAALTELLFAPLWGGLSDRVGRKRILLVGILGYGLAMVLMGVARTMAFLIGARALSGVLTAATMPTAMAYVSDSTAEEDRGGGIGWLGSAAGLGVILGPGLGGWLGGVSLSLPFFVGAGLAFVGVFLIWILLPEADPLQARGVPLSPTGRRRDSRSQRLREVFTSAAGFPLLLLFIASLALANFEAVFGLYAAAKFGYGPARVGTILVVIGLVTTLGKGLLTGPLTRRWGDVAVIKGSLIAGAVGYLVLLAAFDYVTVLLATGFFILSKTVLRPALLSLISKRVKHGQGAVMGMSNTVINLARVIGPLWAGFAFDRHVGIPYLSGALILVVGFVASFWVSVARSEPDRRMDPGRLSPPSDLGS